MSQLRWSLIWFVAGFRGDLRAFGRHRHAVRAALWRRGRRMPRKIV